MVGQSWTPAMVVMVHVMSTEVRTPWLKKPPMERGRKSMLAAWNVAVCKSSVNNKATSYTHTHCVVMHCVHVPRLFLRHTWRWGR